MDPMTKIKIINLDADTRAFVRQAVYAAMREWPSVHLGARTRRQDMRTAFTCIRCNEVTEGINGAAIQVLDSAQRCEGM